MTVFTAFFFVIMKLERFRRQIDLIDAELINLLVLRENLSAEVGRVKAGAGLPIHDPGREEEIMRYVELHGENSSAIKAVYRTILEESRRLQSNVRRDLGVGSDR